MLEQKLWSCIIRGLRIDPHKAKLFDSVAKKIVLESQAKEGGKKQFFLKAPSDFHKNILSPYLPAILKHIKKEFKHTDIKIVKDDKTLKNPKTSAPVLPPFKSSIKKPESHRFFIKKWNFSSFIQGEGNCFALAVAKSIAQKPKNNQSNPFFIYGASGLGKTHLLHAIGNQVIKNYPSLKIKYLPAERFFNECILHIRKNNMEMFRQKYRQNIDVLLLDDVQIFGKGESTQEEFFHTFETLTEQGSQIVLASDTLPKDIKGLKSRIKTRFGGGVTADIQAPDKETKTAILKAKAQSLKIPAFSEDMLNYMTSLNTNSIREMEGWLNKIKIYLELQENSLSIELLKKLFPQNLPPAAIDTGLENSKKLLKIQGFICQLLKIATPEQLKGRKRSEKLILARGLVIYTARHKCSLSLSQIGEFLGGRDHSTIVKALQKTKEQLKSRPQLAQAVDLFVGKKTKLEQSPL